MAEITLKEYLEKNGDRRVDQEALEAIARPASRVWRPYFGEQAWSINTLGEVVAFNWMGSVADERAYATGNCFPTCEAAEFEFERLKVTVELQRLAEEAGGVDWMDAITMNSCIDYDARNDVMSLTHRLTARIHGAIWFPSDEAARAAIRAVGEARIKTYLFSATV